MLFLCDLKNDIVYYLQIQDYFIENPEKYSNLSNAETESITEVKEASGEEKLHLLMLDPHIPAGAKMY